MTFGTADIDNYIYDRVKKIGSFGIVSPGPRSDAPAFQNQTHVPPSSSCGVRCLRRSDDHDGEDSTPLSKERSDKARPAADVPVVK